MVDGTPPRRRVFLIWGCHVSFLPRPSSEAVSLSFSPSPSLSGFHPGYKEELWGEYLERAKNRQGTQQTYWTRLLDVVGIAVEDQVGGCNWDVRMEPGDL